MTPTSSRSALRGRGLALTGVALAAAVGALALPVAAADYQNFQITGSITAPTDNQVLATSSVHVTGEFGYGNRTGTVTGIDVTVSPADGQPVAAEAAPHVDGGSDVQAFDWTTPALTYNGHYTITATAKGRAAVGPDQTATATSDIALAVPPATPTGVKAAADAAHGAVSISWDANPEPDLVAYGVQRAGPDGAYAAIATVDAPATTYADSPAPGDWRYAVVAIRKGAAPDQLVSSADSQPAATTLAAPPTTSTAGSSGTTGPGTGGGASTSGSSSGTAGAPAAGAARSSSVDLKSFSALLDGRRAPAATAGSSAAQDPDPGYGDTLPFPKAGTKSAPGDQPVLGAGDETATAVVGHGSDGGSRRAGLVAVAAFLLLFVMTMQLRWLLRQTALADLDALALPPVTPAPPVEAPGPTAEVSTPAPPVEPPGPTATMADSGAGPLDDGWGEPIASYAFADPFDPAADGVEPAGPLPSMVPAVPAFGPLDAPDLDVPQPVRRRSRRRLADAG